MLMCKCCVVCIWRDVVSCVVFIGFLSDRHNENKKIHKQWNIERFIYGHDFCVVIV